MYRLEKVTFNHFCENNRPYYAFTGYTRPSSFTGTTNTSGPNNKNVVQACKLARGEKGENDA